MPSWPVTELYRTQLREDLPKARFWITRQSAETNDGRISSFCGLTCTAVGILHSHYFNHMNFLTFSVYSKLFGEIPFSARLAVPNQYSIDWNSQFLAK